MSAVLSVSKKRDFFICTSSRALHYNIFTQLFFRVSSPEKLLQFAIYNRSTITAVIIYTYRLLSPYKNGEYHYISPPSRSNNISVSFWKFFYMQFLLYLINTAHMWAPFYIILDGVVYCHIASNDNEISRIKKNRRWSNISRYIWWKG